MGQGRVLASAGHKLGQIIGDWFEEYFAVPLLLGIADKLRLVPNSRFIPGSRTEWPDADGNEVDYDFVMCLPDGQTPVAFFESFWRRGKRHSKDKARDDSGKLLPMRETYPTTRLLSIIAAGDFTAAAREYARSRGIELFYIAKKPVLDAWGQYGANIDYPDALDEPDKAALVARFESVLASSPRIQENVAAALRQIPGIEAQIDAFNTLIHSRLGAAPLEYRIVVEKRSQPMIFSSGQQVSDFLNVAKITAPPFPYTTFSYEIDFGDGDSFSRDNLPLTELAKLGQHMKSLR